MNHKQTKQKKMGFLRINSLQAALLAVFAAILFVIVSANIGKSKDHDAASAVPAGSTVMQLTDANFQQTIKTGVTLVDFWAVWCAPCRMQGPIVEEVAKEMGTQVKVAKLDVDNNGQTAQMYNIRNIPTILIFKDGKVVKGFVGVQQKETLVNTLKLYIK